MSSRVVGNDRRQHKEEHECYLKLCFSSLHLVCYRDRPGGFGSFPVSRRMYIARWRPLTMFRCYRRGDCGRLPTSPMCKYWPVICRRYGIVFSPGLCPAGLGSSCSGQCQFH